MTLYTTKQSKPSPNPDLQLIILPAVYLGRHRFQEAVTRAVQAGIDENNIIQPCKLELVPSKEMPELSIIDYMMWAVQRKIPKGESRYFDALKNKYGEIIDLYAE